jgi:DNA-binding NtrC family response regulator
MSPRMQAVLLRFTETQQIHRVGSDRANTRVDARIIAATNRHLGERVASGDFRQDLYYRLNVIHITVPPLRERGSDILLLFQHFLERYAQPNRVAVPVVTSEAQALLLAYGWPGNVRELKNVVERIVVRHIDGPVGPDSLPVEIRVQPTPGAQRVSGASAANGAGRHPAADAAWDEMVTNGQSFWTAVHAAFIERELTKTDLRQIIKRGLERTHGSYRKLVDVFNMSPGDYKRFLAFLYQHDCHLAFHPFREGGGATERRVPTELRVARGGR